MVISIDYLKSVINDQPKFITTLKQDHKKLRMHYHGVGIKDFLKQITGLENPRQLQLREEYSRSNKDLFANITAPVYKIFSARGKNKRYELPTSKSINDFREYLSTIDNGKSLEAWLSSYWKDKVAADPNGIFLIEKDKDGNPYPTYKSILSIRDYKQKGQSLEYVIFEPYEKKINDKTYKFVRVYDEEGDKLYKIVTNDNIVQIEEETYTNDIDEVPGCIISTIENTVTGFKKSTIDNEIELADEYFRDNSVKTIYKLTSGFPLFWMYYSQCPVCKGTGEVKAEPCKACNGTGYAVKKDVSEIIGIKPPTNADDVRITPDIAGYITPPNDNLNQMTDELALLKSLMQFSHWGTIMEVGDNNTATGKWIDTQPVYDRLNQDANGLEIIETILVDYIGKIKYKNSYKGCSINYGRAFQIETPDQAIDKYIKAKKEKLNQTTLDYLLDQYYQAQFATDPVMLSYYQKLVKIEPFVHLSIGEIPTQYQGTLDYNKKFYFNEWKNTVSVEDILQWDSKKINKNLENYINSKNLNNQQDGPKEV